MRSSGVLLNISSLPSEFGIGGFGSEIERFSEFIAQSDMCWWQVLPITTIGAGNSPYSGVSAFAGNYMYIDPIKLLEKGYITYEQCDRAKYYGSPHTVDYDFVSKSKKEIIMNAYNTIAKSCSELLISYMSDNRDWLVDYAIFMCLKDEYNGAPWQEWTEEYRCPNRGVIAKMLSTHEKEIGYYVCEQFLFDQQWSESKTLINKNNIGVIGDIPIYVCQDSVDVWASPKMFDLDKDLNPRKVAGVPPDYFAEDGQLWGNPIYNYEYMAKDGYSWFVRRIERMFKLYDKLRIDHFRAFDRYWAVPFGSKTARDGKWEEGVGIKLFDIIKKKFPNADIIAEDLGIIDDGVIKLRKNAGFPGMRVMQFGLDGEESPHLPHLYEKESVVYTGTHDNDTTYSWLTGLNEDNMAKLGDYIGVHGAVEGGENSSHVWGCIRTMLLSVSDTVIIPFQDLAGWGTDTRMNTPGVSEGNWKVRITMDSIAKIRVDKMRRYNYISGRKR